jgi:hypothetical protein
MKLVEPGDPDRSLLVVVLEHPTGLPEGLRMPLEQRLPLNLIADVRAWIAAGAPADDDT